MKTILSTGYLQITEIKENLPAKAGFFKRAKVGHIIRIDHKIEELQKDEKDCFNLPSFAMYNITTGDYVEFKNNFLNKVLKSVSFAPTLYQNKEFTNPNR